MNSDSNQTGAAPANANKPSRQELVDAHLSRLVDYYKHHYELSQKAYLIYLAIVSAIASVVFGSHVDTFVKIYLLGMAVLISVVSGFAGWISAKWITKTQERIDVHTTELGLQKIPFDEPRKWCYILMFVTISIGVFFLIGFVLELLEVY